MSEKGLHLDESIKRGRTVSIRVDGEEVAAFEGETLAAVLTAEGRRAFGHTPSGKPRGLFCGIGMCFDCLVSVDGRNVRACVTPVREGMAVRLDVVPKAQQRS